MHPLPFAETAFPMVCTCKKAWFHELFCRATRAAISGVISDHYCKPTSGDLKLWRFPRNFMEIFNFLCSCHNVWFAFIWLYRTVWSNNFLSYLFFKTTVFALRATWCKRFWEQVTLKIPIPHVTFVFGVTELLKRYLNMSHFCLRNFLFQMVQLISHFIRELSHSWYLFTEYTETKKRFFGKINRVLVP